MCVICIQYTQYFVRYNYNRGNNIEYSIFDSQRIKGVGNIEAQYLSGLLSDSKLR